MAPASCVDSRDCVQAINECQRWDCVERRCVTREKNGGACDERDLCTVGTCASGRCVVIPRQCDSDDACLTPSCRPDTGCEAYPVDGGFCEAPGATWGECVGPLMHPADRCEASGRCSPTAAGGTPAPEFGVLNGDWLVFRHGLGGPTPSSSQGTLNMSLLGADATATFLSTRANGLPQSSLVPTVGSWCMAPARGFHINLPGVAAWDGQVDVTGEAFGAYGFEQNELVLGLRGGGAPSEVTGSYRIFAIRSASEAQIAVWVGTASFESGCLTTVGRLQSAGGTANLELRAGQCLMFTDPGAQRGLLTGLWNSTTAGQPPIPLHFEGGASSKGDLVFGSWVDHGEGEVVGLVVAVRESRADLVADSQWFAAFHEVRPGPGGGPGDRAGQRSLLQVEGNRIINGIGVSGRFGAMEIPPVPAAFHWLDGTFRVVTRDGRIDLSPRTAARKRIWSGTVGAESRLGFFTEVEPWTAGGEELVRPAWPSFGFVIESPTPR